MENIYCIGRNYAKHATELGNAVPKTNPVVFMKPNHALVRAEGQAIYLPKERGSVHYETELVLKMGKDYTPELSVDEMISEITIGLDLTLRDVQSQLKEKQHPWLISKGFPNAAVVGEFIPFPSYETLKETHFYMTLNGENKQTGDIKQMIFPIEFLLKYIGENLGLKKGDLIFTGTPEGVGPLTSQDEVELIWGKKTLGKCKFLL